MAKPILIVSLPHSEFEDRKTVIESTLYAINKIKEQTDNEYHVILYFTSEDIEPKFEVLNAKNATKLNIEELQDKLLAK